MKNNSGSKDLFLYHTENFDIQNVRAKSRVGFLTSKTDFWQDKRQKLRETEINWFKPSKTVKNM